MAIILTVFQISIIVILVILVLLQRNSSEGLSGLAGGGHNAMSPSSAKGAMNKVTIFFIIAFMLNSIAIAKIYLHKNKAAESLIIEAQHSTAKTADTEAPVIE